MQIRLKSLIVIAVFLILLAPLTSTAQTLRPRRSISTAILVRIISAEDERRWDGDLLSLLTNRDPVIRKRAALAAGRIGNEGSLAELSNILSNDKDQDVREMAAFAIGEVESLSGAHALLTALKSSTETDLDRARAIEGLGKIAAALSKEQQARSAEISTAILEALKLEMQSQSPNRQFILL